MMRKVLTAILVAAVSLCMIKPVCAEKTISNKIKRLSTTTEIRTYCEIYQDREDFPKNFIMPQELAFLGDFVYVDVPGEDYGPLAVFDYKYTISFAWNEQINESLTLEIMDNYTSDFLEQCPRVHTSNADGNLMKIKDYIEMSYDPYVLKRGQMIYIYFQNNLNYVQWKSTTNTFRFYFNLEWNSLPDGDNIITKLISLEEEPFLEAQRQLLNIGNPNPVPPEPEKACGGDHVYAAQWDFDDNTHWYPCICGAKSEQGFHMDENQDGACDICLYDLNGENVSDPVVDPVQPTQPTEPTEPATQPTEPTEPATQPTEPTQPTTAAPTALPTQPSPAEPDAPSVGLWIGISAAVLAAAAALLLLRKKK